VGRIASNALGQGGVDVGSGGALATQWLSAGKPSTAVSDILELTTPTGSSAFVLSMNYDPASENANLWLGWNSGSNGWVNSVDGNTGNNSSAPTPLIAVGYTPGPPPGGNRWPARRS